MLKADDLTHLVKELGRFSMGRSGLWVIRDAILKESLQ